MELCGEWGDTNEAPKVDEAPPAVVFPAVVTLSLLLFSPDKKLMLAGLVDLLELLLLIEERCAGRDLDVLRLRDLTTAAASDNLPSELTLGMLERRRAGTRRACM